MNLTLPQKLLAAYVAFIIYGTTIPFDFQPQVGQAERKFVAMVMDIGNLSWQYDFSLPDILSNILLFAPFGFIFNYCVKNGSLWAGHKRLLFAATMAGTLLSIFVECVQLFTPARISSFLDVFSNGSGALGGALLGVAFRSRLEEQVLRSARHWFQAAPQRAFLAAYAALLVISQLAPFDVTIDLSSLAQAIKNVELTLPASPAAFGDLLSKSILFAAFSFLWRYAHVGSGRYGGASSAIFASTLSAIGIELCQLFIVSHTTKLADMLAGLLGGCYGVIVFMLVSIHAQKSKSKTTHERLGLVICNLGLYHWLLYIFLSACHPFRFDLDNNSFAQQLARFSWLPYVEYYNRTEVSAVFDLGEEILQYALFAGLLLERRHLKQLLETHGELMPLMVMALGLSLLLEWFQIFLPDRSAGITDCINSVLGVIAGYWLWHKWREQLLRSSHHDQLPSI